MRMAKIKRKTLETDIEIEINLEGTGKNQIDTGIGIFNHMLTLFAFHSNFDLVIKCKGDLWVDEHHTLEDLGITLGRAFYEALGDKKGIKRYSNIFIPMDESLARIVVDISNRPYLVYDINFEREKIGNVDTQNFKEFFRAFVQEARITLHIASLYGENNHHIIEGVFKGIGRALKESIQIVNNQVASSKGVL
ncbi:imidazoleglycerol-phosphate dehydratase HisB [Haloimpatiens sp. FM7330]|uniref:imidazoleglycerol-phosphate dehydratase HisB n=1 Tax=Haloimpatiens sp. FM7330 TaxID=3298610 RepID=UPI003642EF0A